MYEEYDKSLHPPLKYKSMESEARVLDETTLDSAIAVLLEKADDEALDPGKVQATFPELPDQAQIDSQTLQQEAGLTAVLLQKWAELRGAA